MCEIYHIKKTLYYKVYWLIIIAHSTFCTLGIVILWAWSNNATQEFEINDIVLCNARETDEIVTMNFWKPMTRFYMIEDSDKAIKI